MSQNQDALAIVLASSLTPKRAHIGTYNERVSCLGVRRAPYSKGERYRMHLVTYGGIVRQEGSYMITESKPLSLRYRDDQKRGSLQEYH